MTIGTEAGAALRAVDGLGCPAERGASSPAVLLVGESTVATRPGGLNRYLESLLDALRQRLPATALVVGEGDPQRDVLPGPPADAPLIARLLALRRAAAAAPTTDVVDVHFALYGLLPVTTTRLRSVPLIAHFQGPWAEESRVARGEPGLVTAAKAAVEKAVYQRAAAIIVLSRAFGDLVTERYGVDPSRVVVIPPGVDLERFTPGDRATARARLGLPQRAFVAVVVRRLDPRMGLDVLLDAWARVQQQLPDAVLVIAGEGRERDRLDAQRRTLPDPPGVRLPGRVSEEQLVDLYRAADCSVVPTRALEGFGLVTLESAACGTPAVVTDVGGLPDGVVGLDPSLVVPAEDPDALADRLLRAAAGQLPSREATRRHAEQFSWDAVARAHVELYRRVARPPLRVAYLGHTAALSGGELALARLLPALRGVEPIVILGEDGPLVGRLRAQGATVEVLPMSDDARRLRRDRVGRSLPGKAMLGSLGYARRLARRLRQLDVDLVHTNTLKAALYGGLAGRLAGVPVVWHVRDRIAVDYLPRPAVTLVRALARVLPAAVIANSATTLATVRRRPAHRDDVVPSPLDPSVHERQGSGPTTEGAGSSDPAGPGRPLTVGLVGRLAPWKGQDLFLRAFAAAFPEGGARARIVGSALFGEDAWAESLRSLATSLGLDGRVEFVGFTDDVAAEYAQMDVLVHASTVPEPFGQVVVEGMAAGLAVVAADAGGPAEIISDGVDGLLYPMGDADALAGRLRELAGDPALRARLGEAARGRAQDFTPERAARKVEQVYRSVMRRRDRRARFRRHLAAARGWRG